MKPKLRFEFTPRFKKVLILAFNAAAVAGAGLALFTDIASSLCFTRPH
jgi:hypothetical protein